jgi:hypothetical protein
MGLIRISEAGIMCWSLREIASFADRSVRPDVSLFLFFFPSPSLSRSIEHAGPVKVIIQAVAVQVHPLILASGGEKVGHDSRRDADCCRIASKRDRRELALLAIDDRSEVAYNLVAKWKRRV